MTRTFQANARPREADDRSLPPGLERARALFEARIEEQVLRIEQCRRDVKAGRAPDRALSEIAGHAHKIAGVAGTVGHPRLGELAGRVETLIGQARSEGLSETAILKGLHHDLEQMLDALEAALLDG